MDPSDAPTRRRPSPDEFASLVSHELRNPLNALAGWLHLLAAEPAVRGDAPQRALHGMRRALEQQLEQIDVLARVLRLREGARVAGEPVELGALADACARALRPAAESAGRGVEIDHDASAGPAWIRGDRAMLESAVQTLARFALRHGEPGAMLRLGVGTDRGGPALRLAIDEGRDGGLSVWHAFGAGGARLPLELLHAALVLEAHGARVAPLGDGRVGDALGIRFEPSAGTAPGDASPVRPHA